MSSVRVSGSGVIDHVKTSGTGRSACAMISVGRPVRSVSFAARSLTSPRVALMSMNWACGNSLVATCHAQPRSGSAMKWYSSATTICTSAWSPSRSAILARISAVQQMIGASGFTEASPVTMPTRSGPKSSTQLKNFSLTRALMGAV